MAKTIKDIKTKSRAPLRTESEVLMLVRYNTEELFWLRVDLAQELLSRMFKWNYEAVNTMMRDTGFWTWFLQICELSDKKVMNGLKNEIQRGRINSAPEAQQYYKTLLKKECMKYKIPTAVNLSNL